MEELLPVGSIVALKDKRILMIIGYSPNIVSSEKQYDYIASYVIGVIKPQEDLRYNKDYFYINKSDIEAVLYIGYSDIEFDLYKMVNTELTEQMERVRKEKGKLDEEDIKKVYEDFIKKVKPNGSEKDEK